MSMTDEQINIAIAEHCGWTNIGPYYRWRNVEGFREPLPDYRNDLNAMHEAEKHLNTKALWETYKEHMLNWMTEPVCATARQKSEAFLRTVGKWEEQPMNTPRSSTETLINALRILSRDIDSEDGVANAAISEAADRLEELHNSSLAAVKDTETEDEELNYTHRWDPVVFDRREFDDNAEPGPEAYMVNESYGKWVEYDVADAIIGGIKIRNQILNDRLSETLGLLERVFQCFEPLCHDEDVLYEEAKNFITKSKEEQQ